MKNTSKKILVTGGSGFIGTNAISSFLLSGNKVLSIDIKEPQDKKQEEVFRKADILDLKSITGLFEEFAPTHVVHLAARTDLHEKKNIDGYSANIKGVENLIRAVSTQPSVKKCIFTSTKLVCPTDYTPISDDDYCPNTLYGESKVIGEKIVRNSTTMTCDWCIVRPTSIWGAWSILPHIPYGRFFQMIAAGQFFYPGRSSPPKSFGYVGNTVFQITKLLEASREKMHRKMFYLSDYEVFTIKTWANIISNKLKNRNVRTIPEPVVRILALSGDILKLCGVKEPPFSSFRLHNMRSDTSCIPLGPLRDITGPLPYTMEQGIDETIKWLKEHHLIK